MNLTHQSAKVDEDIVSYEINNKVTVVHVEGNKDSGYLYQIDWFDNRFFRTLECSNAIYSKDIIGGIIDLAQKINNK